MASRRSMRTGRYFLISASALRERLAHILTHIIAVVS